jgi:hypothetical protein
MEFGPPREAMPISQRPLELLLSLNTAFAGMSILFCISPSAALPFLRLEIQVNHLLHIRQTDYIRGYFAIWIPSLAVASCIFILLLLLRNLSVSKKLLRSVAGMTIFLSPCAIWTCAFEHNGWSLDWPYKSVWGEAALAVICLWAFLHSPWVVGKWIGLLAFIAHALFWYFFLSTSFYGLNWGLPHYAGPAGLVLGISAAFIWEIYIRQLRINELKPATAP